MAHLTFEQAFQKCRDECPVEVRDSKRHGKGVFAVRDVDQGELLCEYAGEDMVNLPELTLEQHEFSMEYQPTWNNKDERITRIGFRTPQTAHGCGQFINDALALNLNHLVTADNRQINWNECMTEIETYARKSHAASMVIVDPRPEAKCWLFARRCIRKGEEIVMHYGEDYWLRQILGYSREPSILLAIMCIYEPQFIRKEQRSNEETDIMLKRYHLYDILTQIWNDGEWSFQGTKNATKKDLLDFCIKGFIEM